MVYKKFRFNVILRILLIVLVVYVFFYLIHYDTLIITPVILVIVFIFQIINLIYYVDKTNKELTHFLLSIKHDDFSQTFSKKSFGSSFNDLYAAFNSVMNDFRKIRAEKEEHFNFLQIIIQHVGVGLISFKENGEVNMINNAARKLLKIQNLKNIFDMESLSKELAQTLIELKSGEKSLVKVNIDNKLLQLSIHATEFILREKRYSLVSIQNIHSELEEKEMEAWQNLIRVLTHEIMNSATPITSLAATVNQLFETRILDHLSEVDGETVNDVSSALKTIQKRSEGLVSFVESFRKITRIPRPNFQTFLVSDLLDRMFKLLESKIREEEILFNSRIEPAGLKIMADPNLLEQVIINLLLNSIHAVKNREQKIIEFRAFIDRDSKINIEIADNGVGIMDEVLDKIFIPFFTTKKEGSGIGLSLSRQIMKLHNGTITAKSEPEKETVFTLRF
jgi:two-component system, NtrC family, nitrogen regulation sensor histidine kinase NtrY